MEDSSVPVERARLLIGARRYDLTVAIAASPLGVPAIVQWTAVGAVAIIWLPLGPRMWNRHVWGWLVGYSA